jgi:AhpC/TSA family
MSTEKERHAGAALAAGTPAPEFKLHSTPDQLVSLSDFRGTPVILAFLSGGLESGLRRSDGALQSDPSRVPSP